MTGSDCIAWAYGVSDRWMEPASDDGWWPDGVTNELTIEALVELFADIGYEPCDDHSLDEGDEKVAIYADRSDPLHAARQLASGRWTSKLGTDIDIEHLSPELVEGYYGQVVRILRRPRPETKETNG